MLQKFCCCSVSGATSGQCEAAESDSSLEHQKTCCEVQSLDTQIVTRFDTTPAHCACYWPIMATHDPAAPLLRCFHSAQEEKRLYFCLFLSQMCHSINGHPPLATSLILFRIVATGWVVELKNLLNTLSRLGVFQTLTTSFPVTLFTQNMCHTDLPVI